MDQKDKALDNEQPAATATTQKQAPKPAMKQPRWPGYGSSGGIKNAKSGHDRKTMGRGAARGR